MSQFARTVIQLALISCLSSPFIGTSQSQTISSLSLSGQFVSVDMATDFVSAAYPLALIESSLRLSVGQQLRAARPLIFTRVDLDKLEITQEPDPESIHVAIEITAYNNLGSVTCGADFSFAMRKRNIVDFKIEPGPNPHLGCSGDLAKIFNAQLTATFKKGLDDAFSKSLGASIPNIEDYKNDPQVAALINLIQLQGGTCQVRGKPFLCIKIFFPQGTINELLDVIAAFKPSSDGPMTPADEAAITAFRTAAHSDFHLRASEQLPGFWFPTKGSGDDGDAVIFNGLLCAAGEPIGCEAVKRAQSSTGQVWRSPDRRNDWPDEQAQFSGDQFMGAALYLAKTGDKAFLEKWLSFISTNVKKQPDSSFVLEDGYRSCLVENGKDKTCLLGGTEWFWLRYFGQKLGVPIPIKQTDPEQLYGYSDATLPLTALVNQLGFRLHLVGVQLLLAKTANSSWSSDDQKAADILTVRQSRNAFFLYLSQGRSHRAAQAFLDACTPPTTERSEWIWETDQDSIYWKHSMGWDCLFMAQLLAPGPPTVAAATPTSDTDTVAKLLFFSAPPSAAQCLDSNGSEATVMSPNGRVVAGRKTVGGQNFAYRWTMSAIDYVMASEKQVTTAANQRGWLPTSMSYDGRVIMMTKDPGLPTEDYIVWKDSGPGFPLSVVNIRGLSRRTSPFLLSISKPEAFIWVATVAAPIAWDRPSHILRGVYSYSTGPLKVDWEPLRLAAPNPATQSITVVSASAEGDEIVANSWRDNYIWSDSQGWGPGFGFVNVRTLPVGISVNGSYLFGALRSGPSKGAFVSRNTGGSAGAFWLFLPDSENLDLAGISADGSRIIANGFIKNGPQQAWIHINDNHWVPLSEYLAASGLADQLSGIRIKSVVGISPDGRSFAGTAMFSQGTCTGVGFYARASK